MTIKIGEHEFDQVRYDARGDVLYLRAGPPGPAARTQATPEGHSVSVDGSGAVVGITIVNAKWLIERDGKILITVPRLIETPAEELAPALANAS
jgi:uncharacterized protein YuzE